jgi:HPt (histidine-containing phosphotransfer) domain-containing protein
MTPEATNQGSAGSGVIDGRVIQSLRDLGGEDEPELLSELIEIFLDDAPMRMEDITLGLASGDLARVERGAHTLKSSSANIGALGLSDLCRRILECTRANRTDTLPGLCRESAQTLTAAEEELRKIEL